MKPMATKRTLLLIGGLALLAPAAALAQPPDRKPLTVGNVSGNMHIFQSTPFACSDIEGDVPVTGGRFDLTPAQGLDAGGGYKRFVMTRGRVRMSPFNIDFSCVGFEEHHHYTALSVQVANSVSFLAAPSGPGV